MSTSQSRAIIAALCFLHVGFLLSGCASTPDRPIPQVPISGPACPAFPAPEGNVVEVATTDELHGAVNSATTGDVILLADGTYEMQESLWLQSAGVTLRGASGDRRAVTIDAGPNGVGEALVVSEDDTTIADITISNAPDHCIHVWGYFGDGVDRTIIYNVLLLDAGTQLLKVSTDFSGAMTRDGEVACSRFAYTTHAPSDYTNGIDIHAGERWLIRDNLLERIRGPGDGTAGPAILVWSASVDTIVERNVLVDCFRGIAFGNPSHEFPDHIGGVVRNNFIAATIPGDAAIEMAFAENFLVAFNTVAMVGNDAQMQSAEARGAGTSGRFVYNLTTSMILAERDGASSTAEGNVTSAVASWFADVNTGDLHLTDEATLALDAAQLIDEVPTDVDGDDRSSTPDVGADER